MVFSKSKMIAALTAITLSICASAAFTDSACLKSSFDTTVSHKSFPLGFADTTINVKKDGCVITILHKKMKYMKKKWVIDVCRGPIHIKYGTGSIDVFKRLGNCKGSMASDYCSNLSTIELLLQDDGLIFADGDKGNLDQDHGKIYCSYMLALSYLNKGLVFNREQEYSNVLIRGMYKSEAAVPTGSPLLALPRSRKTVDTQTIEAGSQSSTPDSSGDF
ncbi:MAG: hypothetical protein KAG61_05705 [Bacteriovoracaceae bacterium]|nr:hypothetical protein [Bacteriovoracaceae bacterium]